MLQLDHDSVPADGAASIEIVATVFGSTEGGVVAFETTGGFLTASTAVVKDGMVYAQAGAGIVHDSVPESEWTETENKARAIFRAADMVQQGLDTTE